MQERDPATIQSHGKACPRLAGVDSLRERATHAAVSSWKEFGIIAAVGAGTFIFALQAASVLVALPVIRVVFRPGVSAGWVATIYLLCLTGFLLIFGRLGDLFGTRRLYIAGLMIFTLASLVCAAAHLSFVLLAARSAQGIGAALASANSLALLTRNLSRHHRGRALGYQATMTYFGLALGSRFAATLIAHFSWHAIFLVEVPAGILATLLALSALPVDTDRKQKLLAVPVKGSLLWVAWLVPLVVALGQGTQWGWHSVSIVGLLVASMLIVFAFIRIERHSHSTLIPISLCRSKEVCRSILCETLLYGGLYAINFVVAMTPMRSRGLGTAMAGTLLMSQSLTRLLVTPLAGFLADWLGSSRLISVGSALFAGSALLLFSRWEHASSTLLIFLVAFAGLGPSLFVPANSTRLFANVSPMSHATASGMLATARNLGMLFGTAGAAAFCSDDLRVNASSEVTQRGVRNVFGLVLVSGVAMLITEVAPRLLRAPANSSRARPVIIASAPLIRGSTTTSRFSRLSIFRKAGTS